MRCIQPRRKQCGWHIPDVRQRSWINLSGQRVVLLRRLVTSWVRIATTWIQVEFLDANTNVLALYKSANFSASVGLEHLVPIFR